MRRPGRDNGARRLGGSVPGRRSAIRSKGEMFAGCAVAMVTPFHQDGVDEDELRHSVDRLIGAGVSTLCPAGTTGESPTLTRGEHERVIAAVVDQAAGRARVLAGAGS